MIRIAVLTTTRAEYGLMRQLIFRMRNDSDIEMCLLVTGTHLSQKYGMTINEIIDDKVPIYAKINIIAELNGKIDVSKTMARAIEAFSELFSKDDFDLLFVDGDRYEALAVCIAAVNNKIPIAHCGGGAVTKGADDECWRHAITKLSSVHFPTMEIYKDRIVRMGENPKYVCVSGSPGIENIRMMKLGNKHDVETRFGFSLGRPYALVTFHPATKEGDAFLDQVKELLDACSEMTDMKYIFTKANADQGGDIINEMLEDYCEKHRDTSICVSSMGVFYYLTAMKYCELVLGNSSSGLIEAPSFHIPTVNIGSRQEGREKAKSVIDCLPRSFDIVDAVKKARSREFREMCKNVINPNGDGHASERIIGKIKELHASNELSVTKDFFDI